MKQLLLILTLLGTALVPATSFAGPERAERAEPARLKEARAAIREFASKQGVVGEGRLRLRSERAAAAEHPSYRFEKIGATSRSAIEGVFDRATRKVVRFEIRPLLTRPLNPRPNE